jgi:hypothetical protein
VRKPSLEQLESLLRLAGAPHAEGWARSEYNEDIPQLARFLFLRQAWARIVAEGDTNWIDREIAASRTGPTDPGSGMGVACERLLTAGGSREDISEVARHAQWQLLHSLCYLLDDPSLDEDELSHVGWLLLEVAPNGELGRPISGLHESVLETDPTGREMRPRTIA